MPVALKDVHCVLTQVSIRYNIFQFCSTWKESMLIINFIPFMKFKKVCFSLLYPHPKLALPNSCCSVAQLCLTLCNPMDATFEASLSFTISQSLLKLTSIESMMPSNHFILCSQIYAPKVTSLVWTSEFHLPNGHLPGSRHCTRPLRVRILSNVSSGQ